LWPPVQQQATALQSEQMKLIPALAQAGSEVMSRQLKHIAIPRRFSQMARDIWTAQPKFERTKGKQTMRLIAQPWFRAAYDFMCIQSMVGLVRTSLFRWWTDFQQSHPLHEKQQNRREPRRNRPARKRQAS